MIIVYSPTMNRFTELICNKHVGGFCIQFHFFLYLLRYDIIRHEQLVGLRKRLILSFPSRATHVRRGLLQVHCPHVKLTTVGLRKRFPADVALVRLFACVYLIK